MDNSQLTASLFSVVFTPDNRTITFNVVGTSTITGNVTMLVDVKAYGATVISRTVDPCTMEALAGMCPMTNGPLKMNSNFNNLSPDVINAIPSLTYGVPDIDLKVTVKIDSSSGQQLACLEARLVTSQTVNLLGVKWATAAVIGLAVLASAVISGLGHLNAAAHIASYALSLFSYFQAVAICGLVAVYLPPLALAWTLDFDWTMGIITVNFLQRLATWYQKATGGTPSTLLNTLTTTSVNIQKRAEIAAGALAIEPAGSLMKRVVGTSQSGSYTVTGASRIAFVNNMETTNLFLTGLIFFNIFIILTIIAVLLFKLFCEFAAKAKWMKKDSFQDFRNGYLVVLKGIMFRIILIGFPQMSILCLWEFYQVDSPAEVVLAVFYFFGMCGTLGWAAVKVILLARRSQQMHKNPAYILYSDPNALNKWGFLYVQFRATAYYYIVPVLVYSLLKAMFIGLAQKSGTAQAVGLVVIESAALISASVLRPWMDKSTNSINIAICAINFINAIILLLCANPFGMPDIGVSISGAAFFIINASFSLVLLIIILIVTTITVFKKNPDMRYQPMSDDRASFIKSQTQLTTELDALGATARGGSDLKTAYKPGLDLDDDDESFSSGSLRQKEAANTMLPPSTAGSHREPPHSPANPSEPFLPPHGGSSTPYSDRPGRQIYNGAGYDGPRGQSPSPAPQYRPGSARSGPNGGGVGGPGLYRPPTNSSQQSGFRAQNNAR
jgi:hypothetical protein